MSGKDIQTDEERQRDTWKTESYGEERPRGKERHAEPPDAGEEETERKARERERKGTACEKRAGF